MIRLPIGAGGALIAGAALGLALAPHLDPPATLLAAGLSSLALITIVAVRVRSGWPGSRLIAACGIATLAVLAGFIVGQLRLATIDASAFGGETGERIAFTGHLEAPPRSNDHETRLQLSGPRGKVAVLSDRLDQPLPVGSEITVQGRVEEPPAYLRGYLERRGIQWVVRAERIEVGPARGGIPGLLDGIRERALAGMGTGLPDREAALAAGFVLGQDGAIDSVTAENFKRAGLSHLLAASGQNVMLLVLLGTVPLIIAGVSLRRRVPLLIAMVLVYLPLTGVGPSIQRAAVMGVVMLLVLWLGGAGSRLTALLIAAALTLLANPRASGDVGWQLSFAATTGIMLLAPDLRWLLLNARLRRGESAAPAPPARDRPLRRLLADGTAVTAAATLSTAPLISHHFEALPLASMSANLLVLPAVAPVMWLGMIAGLFGQLPGIPTEAVNWLNGFLIAYIAEVAAAISALPGAVVPTNPLGSTWTVALGEILVLAAAWALLRWLRRPRAITGRAAALSLLAVSLVVLIPVVALIAPSGWLGDARGPPEGLRIVALDVGQGDAILIQVGAASLLIDTGPPQTGIVRSLRRYGVEALDAIFITHADLDHIGGLDALRNEYEVAQLLHADPPRPGPAAIKGSNPLFSMGSPPGRILTMGQRLRLGEAEIEVLWPPSSPVGGDEVERNARSLVLLLNWRGYKVLLTGDAEAEAAAYSPGDIDLLKVAHHGSADQGLPGLLAESTPELALISSGRDNRHGHPHPSTLQALRRAGVEAHRTDLEGDLIVELP